MFKGRDDDDEPKGLPEYDKKEEGKPLIIGHNKKGRERWETILRLEATGSWDGVMSHMVHFRADSGMCKLLKGCKIFICWLQQFGNI